MNVEIMGGERGVILPTMVRPLKIIVFTFLKTLSPEASCESRSEGGPNVFTVICVRKRILEFQFTDVSSPF